MFATSFVLGYHGCDGRSVKRFSAAAITCLRVSMPTIGSVPEPTSGKTVRNGRYPGRSSCKNIPRSPTTESRLHSFIGAIIDLGNCLDLSDAGSLTIIRNGYEQFKATTESASAQLPVNESAHDKDTDLVKRHLDCAVVNFVHALRDRSKLRPFDTVRGIFTEGGELYPGANIQSKTHVQVCVRKPATSIKGYFRPLADD